MKITLAFVAALSFCAVSASAQVYIGTNPSGNADWGLQYFTADLPLRSPGQLGSPWNSDSSVSWDGPGNVTAPNGFGTYLEGYNYPAGTYTMTFNATNANSGILSATGVVSVLSKSISGNTVTAQVKFAHNDPANLQSGSGWFGWQNFGTVSNVHVTMPGGTPGGLTPWSTKYLANEQAIRFMDVANVNQNIKVSGVADIPQDTNGFSISYTAQARMANAAYTAGNGRLKNIMINLPINANDAYIKAVADQIRDTLNPKIQVKMELGNENWNTATFAQAGYVLSLSRNDSRLQGSDDYGRQGQEAGIMEYHAAQVFQKEFSAADIAAKRVTGVLGGQGTNTYFADKARQGIQIAYGVSGSNIAKVLGDVAVSVYPGDYIKSASSVSDLFNQVRGDFARQAAGMQQASADAKANGQVLDVYEWSPKAYLTQGGVSQSLINAAVNDPAMYQLTKDLWNQVMAPYMTPGGTAYAFDGPGSGWGGQVNPMGVTEQEARALLDLLNANAGTSTGAGTGSPGAGSTPTPPSSGAAVPEPSSLMSLGLLGLFLRRPRRVTR